MEKLFSRFKGVCNILLSTQVILRWWIISRMVLTFHEAGAEYIIVTEGEFLRRESTYPHVHLTRAVGNNIIDTVCSVDSK